jgi:hypothetical protein
MPQKAYKIHTWNPELGAKALADANGVTLMAIYSHAKKHGLTYVKKPPGDKGPYRSKLVTRHKMDVSRLLQEFRLGSETAIGKLAELGIKARRA